MSFDIFLTEQAAKDLEKLDENEEERIKSKLKDLAKHPGHFGKPLKGPKPLWVLKIGQSSWRAVYKKYDEEEKIVVIAVGHRRNVYNQFP